MKKNIIIKILTSIAILFMIIIPIIIAETMEQKKDKTGIRTVEELLRDYEVYGDFIYEVVPAIENGYDQAVVIHKYIGTATEIEIPEEINGMKVIKIQGQADLENGGFAKSVKRVYLPDCVRYIGAYAFAGSNVEYVHMYGSTIIGAYAFANCRNLETVDEAGGNFYSRGLARGTKVGEGVFFNCVSLEYVELPELEYLPERFFEGCKSMSTVRFWDSFYAIGEGALRGCSGLTDIEFSPNITTIDKDAFEGCSSLQDVELPANLKKLENNAFKNCTSLINVWMPKNVDMDKEAFYGCTALREVQYYDK